MALARLDTLYRRARYTLRHEGWWALLRQGVSFVLGRFFSYGHYYIYEREVGSSDTIVQLRPRIACTARIISSPDQVDQLPAEGLHLASYLGLDDVRKRIARGSVLFCVFVGRQLAHSSWVALSQDAKKDIDPIPYTVDFAREACLGNATTLADYRGAGIHTWVIDMRCRFANDRGLRARLSVNRNNTAAQKAQAKAGTRIHSAGRYLRLLRWHFWREECKED